jgi:hypothetical protein
MRLTGRAVRGLSGAQILGQLPTKESKGALVCGRSFLPGIVCTEIVVPAVHGDSGLPLAPLATDAGSSGHMARDSTPYVFPMRAVSEICDAIVRRISVMVIDVARRVLAMNVEPRQAMRIMRYSVHLDTMISAGAQSPRFACREPGPVPHPPAKATGRRQIPQHFFQALLRQAQLPTALLRHAPLHTVSPAVRAARSCRAANVPGLTGFRHAGGRRRHD